MSMNKAFIFDWSGTLSDNFHCFAKVCAHIFQDANLRVLSDDEIRASFDSPYMKFWNKFFPKQTQAEHHQIYTKYISQAGDPELYSGVSDVLKELKAKGYKLFVVSSDPLSKLTPEVTKSGLGDLLSKVIGNIPEKEETLKNLVPEFNLDKQQTFSVGDTAGDIVASKAAGLKTIGISWGFQHKDVLAQSHPDFLIDDISEIKTIVDNLSQ